VEADYPIVPAISCGSAFDQAEDRVVNLVFHATALHLGNDELIFGNPPEELILHRSSGTPGATTTVDPAVYGKWEAAGNDPGLYPLNLPPDVTLTVTVTEGAPGSDRPWNLEITLGCQIWDADMLAAHPYSEPLPEQLRAGCGPLATAEHGVAFTILQSDWPLGIDDGDLIFGVLPRGIYLHPAK